MEVVPKCENMWKLKGLFGVAVVAQWLRNPTRNHEVVGSIPGLAQWVKGLALPWLWCRSQMRLGSHVAVTVVQAGGYSSDLTPSLGTGAALKRKKRKKKKIKDVTDFIQ